MTKKLLLSLYQACEIAFFINNALYSYLAYSYMVYTTRQKLTGLILH